MKLVTLALFVGLACLSPAQLRPLEDFVLSGEKAYGMLPPEPISGGAVSELKWSDDGKYLLALRSDVGAAAASIDYTNPASVPPPIEQTIICYDLLRRRANVVWRGSGTDLRVEHLNWITGSETAVAVVTDDAQVQNGTVTRQTVLCISANAGTAQSIVSTDAKQDGSSELSVEVCPTAPIAVVFMSTLQASRVASGPPSWTGSLQFKVVSPGGKATDPITVKRGFRFAGWTPDGRSPVVLDLKRGEDGRSKPMYLKFSLSDGSVEELDSVSLYKPPASGDLTAAVGAGTAELGKVNQPLHSGWVTTGAGDSTALAAGDVTMIALSPAMTGVAYVSQGVAMVRRLIHVPKELFLNAKRSAERVAIMTRAKQAALAAIMFATDSNDRFPSSQENIPGLLGPYVGNSKLLDGFVYTFGGGFLSDIKNPVATELGYIEGPGGKAVAYADGHVKWISNP